MSVIDKFRLTGKVAIVTGAGRGLGKAMALALADAGAHVAVIARSKDQILETSEQVSLFGVKSLPLSVDLTDRGDIASAVRCVVDHFGHIDILVNNAGVALIKPLVTLPHFNECVTQEEFMTVIETNYIGPVFLTQAVGQYFVAQKCGKVININSVDACRGGAFKTSYASSKAAMLQFTKALANEWARYNICVNAISPGAFHTEMSKKVYEDEKLLQQMHARIPMRRSGKIEELGPAVVFLASEASSYVTGIELFVDGGYMIF